MSKSKEIFAILWDHARANDGPFEVSDVAGPVADKTGSTAEQAKHEVRSLLGELERTPAGEQYFALEGDAVVPQPEYARDLAAGVSADRAYPFEV